MNYIQNLLKEYLTKIEQNTTVFKLINELYSKFVEGIINKDRTKYYGLQIHELYSKNLKE